MHTNKFSIGALMGYTSVVKYNEVIKTISNLFLRKDFERKKTQAKINQQSKIK